MVSFISATCLFPVPHLCLRHGVVVKSKNTNLNKVSSGKITKVSERVRVGKKGRGLVKDRKWRDSGFGADSDIENEEEEFDEVVPEAIVA